MGAALAALLAAPGVVFAVAPAVGQAHSLAGMSLEGFTPAGVDSRLAEALRRAKITPPARFHFTPAGVESGQGQSMTVAVRARLREPANAVQVRERLADVGRGSPVKLAATSYSLGAARGWQSFTLPIPAVEPGRGTPLIENGAESFSIAPAQQRHSPARLTIESRQTAAATRTSAEPQGDIGLDVGGHYRLNRVMDLTAGVRVKANRVGAAPLTDERQDSQAVYLGTLIRF